MLPSFSVDRVLDKSATVKFRTFYWVMFPGLFVVAYVYFFH